MDWVAGLMPWITVIVALMYAAFVEWLNHKYK